ncbi:transporter [Methylocystis bryophila]|uniref:Transporter n=2 Tax=Methylocystis bryophila TaxID=655015 RepID=A0A1W6N176_9HYPH|nr:transporter [Methylocystis bryophila]
MLAKRARRPARAAGLLGLTILTVGCAVGPDFVPPEVPVNEDWLEHRDRRVSEHSGPHLYWWKVFKDPTLDRLIEIASEQNLPLQVSGLRILESRAQLGVAVGELFPQVQQGTGLAQENLLSSRVANQNLPVFFRHNFPIYSLGFQAGWELDFWGRLRRNVEAADAKLLATAADYDNALVSLTAEVARDYTWMRTYEALIRLAHENAKVQKEGLDVAESRFRNGAVSELDVTQARTLLESTLASIPEYQSEWQKYKNALSVLLGRPPGAIESLLCRPAGIPSAPKSIGVGLPANLLRRRPDIRAAELAAAAESARIGAAEAELYPRFVLSGEVGVQASDVHKLFAPHSLAYTLGPTFTWPILNYGQITNNVRAQDARFQQALTNYEQTVLSAQREVEDGLIGYLKEQESAVNYQRAVEAALESVRLSMIQYREGATDYLRVLNSQTSLLQQRNRLVEARSTIALNLIGVYRGLGGGWEIRNGKPVVPIEVQADMASRTNWGDLLPAPSPPPTDALPLPTPAGAAPALRPPDW